MFWFNKYDLYCAPSFWLCSFITSSSSLWYFCPASVKTRGQSCSSRLSEKDQEKLPWKYVVIICTPNILSNSLRIKSLVIRNWSLQIDRHLCCLTHSTITRVSWWDTELGCGTLWFGYLFTCYCDSATFSHVIVESQDSRTRIVKFFPVIIKYRLKIYTNPDIP